MTAEYLAKCRSLIDVVERQTPAIRRAADWFAATILAGRMVQVFGSMQVRTVVLPWLLILCVMGWKGIELKPCADPVVLGWGDNQAGQLGSSTPSFASLPAALPQDGPLSEVPVVALAVGDFHTLALTADGRVFAWGANGAGQLGDGTQTSRSVPAQVDFGGVLGIERIVAIAAGQNFSLALTASGEVFGWGGNGVGQLGDGTGSLRTTPIRTQIRETFPDAFIVAIAAGFGHSLALSSDGQVLAWGLNINGQLGDGQNGTFPVSRVPVRVESTGPLASARVVAIAAGNSSGYALTSEGEVAAWGSNFAGGLGDGSSINRLSPGKVPVGGAFNSKKVVMIAAGDAHALALTDEGWLYGWGYNIDGQVGNGSLLDAETPVQVNMTGAIRGERVVRISAGRTVSLAVAESGSLYAWGAPAGDGANLARSTPVKVDNTLVPAGSRFIDACAGPLARAVFGVVGTTPDTTATTGEVTGIGTNSVTLNGTADARGFATRVFFEVWTPGEPDLRIQASPHFVGGIGGQQVQAALSGLREGTAYTFRIVATNRFSTVFGAERSFVTVGKTGPELWGWGFNFNGQAGGSSSEVGQFLPRKVPHAITGAIKVLAVGVSHSIAVTTDGEVYSWGANDVGQLGRAIDGGGEIPLLVDLGTNRIVQVAAGHLHTLALTTDGRVFAWGGGTSGQLGRSSKTNSSHPLPVEGALSGKRVMKIAAGRERSHALTADGQIYSWGDNFWGALGIGLDSHDDISSPVAVDTSGALDGKAIVAIVSGSGHVLAMDIAGRLYAWGFNSFGQLGDGTTLNRSSPVEVNLGRELATLRIESVVAGYHDSVAVTTDGQLIGWGGLWPGMLETPTGFQPEPPGKVTWGGLLSGHHVTGVYPGAEHWFINCADGTVFSWGNNGHGQLGRGRTPDTVGYVERFSISADREIALFSRGVEAYHVLVLAIPSGRSPRLLAETSMPPRLTLGFFPGLTCRLYQAASPPPFPTWIPMGDVVVGEDGLALFPVSFSGTSRFWRARLLP